MLDAARQEALIARLNRVEGQLRGIRRMIQEPRLCVDILQQLAAAEAALNRISFAIFRHHAEHCVPEDLEGGDLDRQRCLTELINIFDRFAGK